MSQITDNFGSQEKESFCFICDNPIADCKLERNDATSNKVQLSTLFCTIVSRYLDLKSFEATTRKTVSLLSSSGDKNLEPTVDCCKSCSVIVETACELYDQFKNLQLYLNWNLQQITEIMKKSNQSTNHQLRCNQIEGKDFKREFMDEVERIKRSEYPHLKLDKIRPSMEQIQNLENQRMNIMKLEAFNDDDYGENFLWAHDHDSNHDHGEGCEMNMDMQIRDAINSTPEMGETLKVKAKEIEDSIQTKTNIGSRQETDSAEDVFHCDFCDEKYHKKNSLWKHQKLRHEGEKLYKCPYCEERFVEFEERRAHTLSHQVFKYKCRFCSKSFPRSNYRIRHEWTHTGLKPFLCSVCERRFNDFRSAKRHLSNQHKCVDNARVIKCFNSYRNFKFRGK